MSATATNLPQGEPTVLGICVTAVDAVTDPSSPLAGQRLVNGWKNSSCPWTNKVTPEHMLPPAAS